MDYPASLPQSHTHSGLSVARDTTGKFPLEQRWPDPLYGAQDREREPTERGRIDPRALSASELIEWTHYSCCARPSLAGPMRVRGTLLNTNFRRLQRNNARHVWNSQLRSVFIWCQCIPYKLPCTSHWIQNTSFNNAIPLFCCYSLSWPYARTTLTAA